MAKKAEVSLLGVVPDLKASMTPGVAAVKLSVKLRTKLGRRYLFIDPKNCPKGWQKYVRQAQGHGLPCLLIIVGTKVAASQPITDEADALALVAGFM